MKINILILAAILVLGAAGLSAADMNYVQTTNTSRFNSSSSELYHPQELSLEAFGMGTVQEHDIDDLGHWHHRHFEPGAGAGLEFFFCRYVGIEAEGFSETTHHTFVNDLDGNLVLRLPVGQTGLDPYIFGGGGHQWEPISTAYGDGGAGLEFRFTHCFGIFADGRFVATGKAGNYGLGRIGLRFNF
jgi:hypothetical protein